MNTATKLASAGGVLLAGSIAFGQAAFAAPVDCTTIGTMQQWYDASSPMGGEGCLRQDKIFDLLTASVNIPKDQINFAIDYFIDANGLEIHTVNLTPVAQPFQTPGVYTFDYTIEIDQTIAPGKTFLNAGVDANVSQNNRDVLVEKDIYNGPQGGGGVLLTSLATLGGGPDGPNPIGGTKVWVYENIEIDEGNVAGETGAIFDVANTFTQRGVPEPMTAALFGLGLLGLGAARRRRAS